LRNSVLYFFFRPLELATKLLMPLQKNNRYLLNNYSPVQKEFFQTLAGKVPSDLTGVYIRNGPNPFY
jgi:carotenoid cleavage dioxygenase-like enzyme